MSDMTGAELARLISQLDAAGALRLRRAVVRQALNYAMLLLGEQDHAERSCLEAVERWLEQPHDPACLQAIAAQLKQEQLLENRGRPLAAGRRSGDPGRRRTATTPGPARASGRRSGDPRGNPARA